MNRTSKSAFALISAALLSLMLFACGSGGYGKGGVRFGTARPINWKRRLRTKHLVRVKRELLQHNPRILYR